MKHSVTDKAPLSDSVTLHSAALLPVSVEQVRFEVGAGDFEAGAPFATKGALQVVTVGHG